MPGLYVITGSNGAGKSSFGVSYLPEVLQAYQFLMAISFLRQKGDSFTKLKPRLLRKQAEWRLNGCMNILKTALKRQ